VEDDGRLRFELKSRKAVGYLPSSWT